ALRWGLADGESEHPSRDRNALRLALEFVRSRGKPTRRRPLRQSWRRRFLESFPITRNLLFRGTERILRRRVPADMPAPQEALQDVRVGVEQGMVAGLIQEREGAARLATTSACRNLVNLFLQREAAKRSRSRTERLIRRVGIVGAGTMGAGIAQLAAMK